MKFQFKQAVYVNGKNYARGFHFVSPETQENAFFKQLLKVNLVISVEHKPVSKEQVLANLPEHQQKLVDKVNKKLQKASEEAGDPPSVEKGTESGDEKSPDSLSPPEDDEEKPEEDKKSKKRK